MRFMRPSPGIDLPSRTALGASARRDHRERTFETALRPFALRPLRHQDSSKPPFKGCASHHSSGVSPFQVVDSHERRATGLEMYKGPETPALDAKRLSAEERARAIADCERRINDARATVLAKNDGVVTAHMTDLEREWLTLSRPDPAAPLMDG
jgi:hypothetical protein